MATREELIAQLATMTLEQKAQLKQNLVADMQTTNKQLVEQTAPQKTGILPSLGRGLDTFAQSLSSNLGGLTKADDKTAAMNEFIAQKQAEQAIEATDPLHQAQLAEAQAKAEKEKLPSEYKPTTKEEAIEFERAKKDRDTSQLSASQLKLKQKDTSDYVATKKGNELRRKQLAEAQVAAKGLPSGLFGKLETSAIKNFDPNNPILSDWQKVKMVLTDAQLMNTAKTKGAISDREMALFEKAAANDDLVSVARMGPVFQKLMSALDVDESSKRESYIRNWGVDPEDWQDVNAQEQLPAEPTAQAPIFAVNPTTKQRIKSLDGGNTWQPA